MLPPGVAVLLEAAGHDATTPVGLGAHNLPDDILVALCSTDGRVVVTENDADFAAVSACPVLLLRKSWWPSARPATSLAAALGRWAQANPDPGYWSHWLGAEHR